MDWGGLNNKHPFLAVLLVGRTEIKVLMDSVSGRGHFQAHRQPYGHCNRTWWKGRGCSLGSFTRAPKPLYVGSPFVI